MPCNALLPAALALALAIAYAADRPASLQTPAPKQAADRAASSQTPTPTDAADRPAPPETSGLAHAAANPTSSNTPAAARPSSPEAPSPVHAADRPDPSKAPAAERATSSNTPATTAAADHPAPPASPAQRQQVIGAMKGLEKNLGFQQTRNFLTRSSTLAAYYRCYYTGKLELPASYDELQLKQSKKPECDVDSTRYDVFFYPIEAVASGHSPVTTSLQNSSLERLLMVVPHEDFHAGLHERKDLRPPPASITEAASTLIGFLTAAEFAREKFGPSSEVYRNLAREPELFLEKAQMVNRYDADLSSLYQAARSGDITAADALAKKSALFARLRAECGAIAPEPSSFDSCPGAANNAGLAFDFTYTKHYPLLYQVFLANGRDVRRTIDAVKQALAASPASEEEAVKILQAKISRLDFGLAETP